MPSAQNTIPDYTAAHVAPLRYQPNYGYQDAAPGQFDDAEDEEESSGGVPVPKPETQAQPEELILGEEDYDYGSDESELFDDNLNDADWDGKSGDFTKQYNRQRRVIEAVKTGKPEEVPKMNPQQKPKANVSARVDDQIKSLSKFAGRIKLGDAESGMASKSSRF